MASLLPTFSFRDQPLGTITRTEQDNKLWASSRASPISTTVDIGTASDDRFIFISMHLRGENTPATVVTIGGVSCTLLYSWNSNTTNMWHYYWASDEPLTTGTTATLDVSWAGGNMYGAATIYSITGTFRRPRLHASATNKESSNVVNDIPSLAATANGAGFSIYYDNTDSNVALSETGSFTEDYEAFITAASGDNVAFGSRQYTVDTTYSPQWTSGTALQYSSYHSAISIEP